MRSYTLGNELIFSTVFVDPATRAPAAPDTVTLQLLDPTGEEHNIAVSNPAVGLYKAIYTPALPGIWSIRWSGTGAVQAAAETAFEIRPTAFA